MINKLSQIMPLKTWIVSGFVVTVLAVSIAVQAQGSSQASELVYAITNQATISYCTEGDAVSVCDPASAKYSDSAVSNTVISTATGSDNSSTQTASAPAPVPTAPVTTTTNNQVSSSPTVQPTAKTQSIPTPDPPVKVATVQVKKKVLNQVVFSTPQKGTNLYRIQGRKTTKLANFRRATQQYIDNSSSKAGTYTYSLRRTDTVREKRLVRGQMRTYSKKVTTVLGEATIKR